MRRGRLVRPVAEAVALLPLLAAVAIVPLIVFLRAVPLDHAVAQYWNGEKTDYDFFSYYKAKALVPIAMASLLAALAVRRRGLGASVPPLPQAALLALYAALVLASAIASPYSLIAWYGFVGRYEGFWVLVCYLALMVSSYILFDGPVRLRALAYCLASSSLVVSVIGVMQRAGLDPFRTRIGRATIMPSAFESLIEAVTFRLPEGRIYSTLGHYNYVGSYAALTLPVFVTLAVGGERQRLRTLSRVAAGLLAVNWIVCGSRAGLVGGTLAGLVLFVALRATVLKYAWRVVGGVLVPFALVLLLWPQVFGRAMANVTDEITNLLAPIGAAEHARLESLPVRRASIVDGRVRLETRHGELVMMNQGGTLSVADGAGRPLEVSAEPTSNLVTIADDRFSDFELINGMLDGRQAIVVRQGLFAMRFLLTDSGFEYASASGRPLPLDSVVAWGGAGHEDAASARVYIWSRAAPLLRRALILGSGPDTFAAVFPQHDFVGKYLAYGTSEMLVDKPHNLYLQVATNTGVLSAVALVAVFLSYAAASCRVYWSRCRREDDWLIGLGFFAGIVGYLGAGMFNDSVVSVAPVFWVMLGAGMRANVFAAVRQA